jgi:hypothetical protein
VGYCELNGNLLVLVKECVASPGGYGNHIAFTHRRGSIDLLSLFAISRASMETWRPTELAVRFQRDPHEIGGSLDEVCTVVVRGFLAVKTGY